MRLPRTADYLTSAVRAIFYLFINFVPSSSDRIYFKLSVVRSATNQSANPELSNHSHGYVVTNALRHSQTAANRLQTYSCIWLRSESKRHGFKDPCM